MSTYARSLNPDAVRYPVQVHVEPQIEHRNRLTTAFRVILAIPHILLVGGPLAALFSWTYYSNGQERLSWGAGGGLLGAVAAVVAVIAWFAIVFTGSHPPGLWNLAAFYLRWRVRAVAYLALLTDEYPPFGDDPYPASVDIAWPSPTRNRVTVAFRLLLVIPQLIALWAIGFAWALTTLVAWFSILFTGRYPPTLVHFGAGALRWSIRVESYLLLLHDEYPPFSLD